MRALLLCAAGAALLVGCDRAPTAPARPDPRPSLAAGTQPSTLGDGIGTPRFTTDQSVTNFSANAQTIPYWRGAYTDPTNGRTYPFTMVGTDPGAGDVTTVVPTVIVPLRFDFVATADPAVHTLD